MAIFKMYNCDFAISLNGVTYKFTHVQSLQIEDPERRRLRRGANAGNKVGISYREGVTEAKTITLTVLDMGKEIYDVLAAAYASEARMDVSCIDRADGSSKTARSAVLSQAPMQYTVDDSPESMDVALAFESFDVDEVHKS